MSRVIADPKKNQYVATGPEQHSATAPVPASFLEALSPDAESTFRSRFEDIVRRLVVAIGTPFYAQDGFIIYQGDSLSLLPSIGDTLTTDLAITSPPYNIGKEYEEPKPLGDYLSWCETWLQQLHDCTTAFGALWLNLGYVSVPGRGTAVPLPYLLWDRLPFHLLQEVVWVYGAGVAAKKKLSPRNEKWLFLTKSETDYTFNLDAIRDPNVKYPNQRKGDRFRCNPLGKNPSDVWTVPKVTTGANRSSLERTGHPAQFPLEIIERIVRASSDSGQLVLDPFAGSGSTGIATVALGRVFLGVEIRRDYCEAAVERFDAFREYKRQHLSQGSLFDSTG